MGKEKTYIPYNAGSFAIFMSTNIIEEIEARVNKYNAYRSTIGHDAVTGRVRSFGNRCRDYKIYELARAMAVLELAREGRMAHRIWGLSCKIAFDNGDLEFCRELSFRNAKEGGEDASGNYIKMLKALRKETADDHVADIMGMVTDELGELSEDDYEELLNDLGSPIVRWRSLNVPKYKDKEAYDAMYEIIRLCYEHKANHTALRMLAMLYVSDSKKNMPNLVKTNLLAGKVMYELGYMEVARRCFLFAANDNTKKRKEPFPDEYRGLLGQETNLEITEEVRERQKFLDDSIASGKIRAYTEEEYRKNLEGELKVEFPDPKKIEKERNELGEKAIKAYEKRSGGDLKERLKGIDEAFKVFTEEPEVYEQAAYLYFMKANIYLNEDDLDKAYDCIKKAYKCKNGKINGMVLLTFAVILSKMGRSSEATVYIFRSYILLGEEFIVEKLGESAMEALEEYL
ncbi:MAG: hypothetical protein K2N56_04890 [Oscillospiraceae bacterium]|nr:hypothetical protein [Oscillospiraceae bacterium]